MMWRKKDHIVGDSAGGLGCGDNVNQILSPRLADREWTYPGAYK